MGSALSSLVFQPPSIESFPSYIETKKQFIWLKTCTNSAIHSFYLDRRSHITVLFSHGNAEDLASLFEWFCEFSRKLDVNVFAYDYEGYGKSSNTPASEGGCYIAIDAAYDYLTKSLKQKHENIILYGRSLGSGPSCYLAEKLSLAGIKIGGLILQSPLLSIYRVALNLRFTMPGDMFPNIDRVPNITCPIWIIHGTRDEVIPFWHGETLFFQIQREYRSRPLWVEGAGHNDIEYICKSNCTFFEEFRTFFLEFLPMYSPPPYTTTTAAIAAAVGSTHRNPMTLSPSSSSSSSSSHWRNGSHNYDNDNNNSSSSSSSSNCNSNSNSYNSNSSSSNNNSSNYNNNNNNNNSNNNSSKSSSNNNNNNNNYNNSSNNNNNNSRSAVHGIVNSNASVDTANVYYGHVTDKLGIISDDYHE